MKIYTTLREKLGRILSRRYSEEYAAELQNITTDMVDALAEMAFEEHSEWAVKVLRDIYVCRKYPQRIERFVGREYDEHRDWADARCEEDHTDITSRFNLDDLESARANITLYGMNDINGLREYASDRQNPSEYRSIALTRLAEKGGIDGAQLLAIAQDEQEAMDLRAAAVELITEPADLLEILRTQQDEYVTYENHGPVSLYSHPDIRTLTSQVEEPVTELCHLAFEKLKENQALLLRVVIEARDKHIAREAGKLITDETLLAQLKKLEKND